MADTTINSAAQQPKNAQEKAQELKNAPVVHVRADSDSTMNEMFAVVENPRGSQAPLSIPYRMRNLPASFFKPPSTGGSKSPSCHSRENSIDSTLKDHTFSPSGKGIGSPQPMNQAPQPHHNRSQSAPVEMQHNIAAVQQHQNQHMHLRQPSYDVSSSPNNLGPLPPGWEPATTNTGQLYFMNHITKTTQWEDPRIQIQQQMTRERNLMQRNGGSPQPQIVQRQLQGGISEKPTRNQQLGPLPQGWDESETPEGEVYFINHTTKSTSWFDPRIPIQDQSVPVRQSSGQQAQIPPPPQVQPQVGLVAQLQQTQQGILQAPKRQQALRLQRLEIEHRVLARRQAELDSMEKERMRSGSANQDEQMQAAVTATQEMLMRQNINDVQQTTMDPFLSTAQQQSELHNRQESADSGLGMGSNFNLGSIPEDMPMETDLDTTLTEATQTTVNAGTTALGANNAAVSDGQANQSGIDSTDQLISSLPGDISNLGDDSMLNEFLTPDVQRSQVQWL